MTVQVTLSAEGANQIEALKNVQRMARILMGKHVKRQGTALPVRIGNETIGSVQVEGVPDEKELTLIRSAEPHPAWQPWMP
jgi:hypothetical protein